VIVARQVLVGAFQRLPKFILPRPIDTWRALTSANIAWLDLIVTSRGKYLAASACGLPSEFFNAGGVISPGRPWSLLLLPLFVHLNM